MMFPIAAFDRIDDDEADRFLQEAGHYLGACERPFGRQSFGLFLHDALVSVAVSASTVASTCGGWPRGQVVELARLCTSPAHRDLTRVALRFWRVSAPAAWSAKYWPVRAVVSYSDRTRHSGNIYRFDGWTKIADVAGSGGGGTYSTPKARTPKSVWCFEVQEAA